MIEKAKKEDIPEIIALQKLAFYDVAKCINNFRIRPLQVTIEDMEETFASYIYFKKVIDRNIAGAVRCKVIDGKAYIENLIVHPNYQNRGIGRALMNNLENRLNSCKYFELFTGKEPAKNINFYQGLGYKIVKEKPASGNEPVLVILEKKLENNL